MDEQDLNKERLELALEAAGLDLWENDLLTGEVTRKAVKTFTELGYSDEEVAHHLDHMLEYFHPDDLAVVKAAVEDHISGRTSQYRCEFRLLAKNGSWVWFANYGRIMDHRGTTPGQRFIGVTFNIDSRKRKEDEIDQINRQLAEQNALLQTMNGALQLLAANDPLTGLANRRTLMELGVKECKRAERFKHDLSVLMVDIDAFKTVKRQLGTSGRRPGDLRGGRHLQPAHPWRPGHSGPPGRRGIRRAAAGNRHRQRPPGGRCATPGGGATSGGDQRRGRAHSVYGQYRCGHFDAREHSFEQLLNHADKALYKAKQSGKNKVLCFEAPASVGPLEAPATTLHLSNG